MRNATSSVWVGHIPENATADISPIVLKHDAISTEPYTGHAFLALEMALVVLRHHGTRLAMKAIGTSFSWTLNQEIVFSAALTGKPLRKQEFQQYCWKRCVIGTSQDYAHALFKEEWCEALRHGDLSRLQVTHGDPMIFCPANNTEYLNVAAYLEPFWGYTCLHFLPQLRATARAWSAPKHGGLKEFIDSVISTIGRVQIKPATECLRGVATYPLGDQKQGRYKMTLTDLMTHRYANAVREGMIDLTLGRSDHEVKIGDIIEMLLSISFAVKDAMLEWEWLGIDMKEWPPQRSHWEMYRIAHLSFVSNMEASFTTWLHYPWHIVYSALRCMASQRVCPICSKTDRNTGGVHNAWAYLMDA